MTLSGMANDTHLRRLTHLISFIIYTDIESAAVNNMNEHIIDGIRETRKPEHNTDREFFFSAATCLEMAVSVPEQHTV